MTAPLCLLRRVHLHDPEDKGVVDLLVAGGRVAAVARSIELPGAGWPCEVVDAGGLRAIPGFVDGHVHLAGGGGEGGAHTRVPPVQLTQLSLAGVTTAVGLLGTDASTRSIAELLACARAIEHGGVTTFCYSGSYQLPLALLGRSLRDDIVHCDRVIGCGELAISDHRSSQPTFDELVRIAADCHVAGMMTGKAGLLHLHLGDGPRGLDLVGRALDQTELPVRTFHPTHLNRNRRLWAEAKDLHRSHGLFADVTAFAPEGPDELGVAEAVADWLDSGLDPARLTASSDGGGCLPVFDADGRLERMDVGRPSGLAGALRELLEGGWPLARVLPVFTRNPARLLRLGGKGELEVGCDADLSILDSDCQVRDVMARGRWLVLGGRAQVRGAFEVG